MMKSHAIRSFCALAMICTCAAGLAKATTTQHTVRQPALANLHKLIVEFRVVPFGVYPDREADSLEQKIRGQVESLLSKAGFEVLPQFSDYEDAPALMFDIDSALDEKCPDLFAVHANVRLVDYVRLRRPSVGRVRAHAAIWRYQRRGDTFLLSRQSVPAALEQWAHDATLAFVEAVTIAAKPEFEPLDHE